MSTLEAKSVRRREDQRLLTGGGNYAADALRSDMLHAILVRSPHAHAQITGIDVNAARGMPGVVAVYTADDLTDVKPIPGGIGFPRPDGGPSGSVSLANQSCWWLPRAAPPAWKPPRR
jgi:aerobic carbon-monoxide dehydrogenase large subunit